MLMMISNITLVASVLITAGLFVSKLSKVQVVASGDHTERIYGCQVSLAGPSVDLEEAHPYETCDITKFARKFSMICKRYEPSRSDETFANHTPMVINIIVFSIFQIEILPSFHKYLISGD